LAPLRKLFATPGVPSWLRAGGREPRLRNSGLVYTSDGKPLACVPEVARTSLSMGTRIVAPMQSSFPDR